MGSFSETVFLGLAWFAVPGVCQFDGSSPRWTGTRQQVFSGQAIVGRPMFPLHHSQNYLCT